MSWKESLNEQLSALSSSEFDYIETKDINATSKLDLGNSGIYMEATVIYFEIKNLTYILKENGRRKTATAYTMYREVLTAIANQNGGFVNCFAPNAFLIVFPGKEDSYSIAVRNAMQNTSALTETFKTHFATINNLEFAMGIDHGHIMGTKNLSDNDMEHITWFGTCIYKAIRIAKECSRPFYVGISSLIYHSLGDDLKISTRRILGIKKSVEMWTKLTYQYENVKKHLYQTNHKISIEEPK